MNYPETYSLISFYLESPNWHHAGKDKLLLCYTCRMYFKRYGRMKPLKDDEIREPPPFIYKAAFENLEDTSVYSGRMRTRRSSTPISSSVNSIRNRILQEGMQRLFYLLLIRNDLVSPPNFSSNIKRNQVNELTSYSPWNHQKTHGFLIISGRIEDNSFKFP